MAAGKPLAKEAAQSGQSSVAGLTPALMGFSGGKQFLEFVLYGSVLDDKFPLLLERLQGLCDSGSLEFEEHEMVFALTNPVDGKTLLSVNARRPADISPEDVRWWHLAHVASQDDTLTQECATIVRKRVDTKLASNDMMKFLKLIGFRYVYEYVAKGIVLSAHHVLNLANHPTLAEMASGDRRQLQLPFKITVSEIYRLKEQGQAHRGREKVTESHLVELSLVVEQGKLPLEPKELAKHLSLFANQLKPIVDLAKVEVDRGRMA